MRYRLRTLFILIAIVGAILACHASRRNGARRQLGSIDRISKLSPRAFCLSQEANADPIIEEAAKLPRLRLVKLPACQITNASLQPLQRLHRLEWLELFATPVTDEGMKAVASLKSLNTLDLRGTKVTDACISSITALPHLSRLNIGNTAISAAGVEAIQRALPKCKIDAATY